MRFFISYCMENKDFVDEMQVTLLNDGIYTWRDNCYTEVGEVFWSNIVTQINKSNAFIVVLSKKYLEKSYCMDEFKLILKRKEADKDVILVPIILEKFNRRCIPDDINTLGVDFSVIRDYRTLLNKIKVHTNSFMQRFDYIDHYTDHRVAELSDINKNGPYIIEINGVDIYNDVKYSVIYRLNIECDEDLIEEYREREKILKEISFGIGEMDVINPLRYSVLKDVNSFLQNNLKNFLIEFDEKGYVKKEFSFEMYEYYCTATLRLYVCWVGSPIDKILKYNVGYPLTQILSLYVNTNS